MWISPKRLWNISSETAVSDNFKSDHFVLLYDIWSPETAVECEVEHIWYHSLHLCMHACIQSAVTYCIVKPVSIWLYSILPPCQQSIQPTDRQQLIPVIKPFCLCHWHFSNNQMSKRSILNLLWTEISTKVALETTDCKGIMNNYGFRNCQRCDLYYQYH